MAPSRTNRTRSNHPDWDAAVPVRRVRFIKRAQALGFTLSEIGALLALDAACICHDTRALAARKLGLIEQKMADLAAMQVVLGGLMRQCDAGSGGADCPIIDALIGNSDCS